MVPVSTADFWALGQSPDSPGRLVEFGYRTRYRRAALCLQRARSSQRPLRNRNAFAEPRSNRGLQRPPAFPDAARQVVLNSRAVGLEKLVEKFCAGFRDRRVRATQTEKHVRNEPEWRRRRSDPFDEVEPVLRARGKRRRRECLRGDRANAENVSARSGARDAVQKFVPGFCEACVRRERRRVERREILVRRREQVSQFRRKCLQHSRERIGKLPPSLACNAASIPPRKFPRRRNQILSGRVNAGQRPLHRRANRSNRRLQMRARFGRNVRRIARKKCRRTRQRQHALHIHQHPIDVFARHAHSARLRFVQLGKRGCHSPRRRGGCR
jgi:hypothetical protein